MEEIYRENIIEHYKHPQNFGSLEAYDVEFFETNPYCSDELGVQIRIMDNKIEDLRFHGVGCAISQATASIISEELKGMDKEVVLKLGKDFVEDAIGIKLGPVRLKCALLALIVVQGALKC